MTTETQIELDLIAKLQELKYEYRDTFGTGSRSSAISAPSSTR